MAVMYLFEAPDMTTEQYDKIIEILNVSNDKVPEGQIFHLACPMDGGGTRVVDVWESEEACNKFFKERLSSAFEQAGLNLSSVSAKVVSKVHNLYGALIPVP